jgi:alanine dehydrogenase
MKGVSVRFIPEDAVRELLNVEEALTLIDRIYRDHGEGRAFLSDPPSLQMKAVGTPSSFRVKGAYVASLGAAGFRLIGMGASSPKGLCYLCDPETSLPFAIIDETWQYVMRSGLTAAVAARYLARSDSKNVGIFGSGALAPYALIGLKKSFPLRQVRVYSKRKESRVRFSEEMERTLAIEVVPVDTPKEAAAASDIVVTVTTADEPLVRAEDLQPGALVCAMGRAQEMDPNVLDWADKFIVDDLNFSLVSGNLWAWIRKGLKSEEEIRDRVWSEIGDIVAGKKAGREKETEDILAVIGGMASCDIGLSKYVFDKAVERGIGTVWNF